MQQKTKDIIIAILQAAKAPILNILKREGVQLALAATLKLAWMSDVRLWIISFVVDYLAEHIAKPVIDLFFRKVGYEYEVLDGKHLLKKIENSADVNEWDHNTNGV